MVKLILYGEGINRLTKLVKNISKDRGLEGDINQILRTEWAIPAAGLSLSELRKQAPVGKKWTENDFDLGGRTISHGRPSERLFGMTLDEGWESPPYTWGELKEAGFDIKNRAPHTKIVLHGHPGAIVKPRPGRRLLAWNRDYKNFGRPGVTQTQLRSVLKRKAANRFDVRAVDIMRPKLLELRDRLIPHVMTAIGKHIKFMVE